MALDAAWLFLKDDLSAELQAIEQQIMQNKVQLKFLKQKRREIRMGMSGQEGTSTQTSPSGLEQNISGGNMIQAGGVTVDHQAGMVTWADGRTAPLPTGGDGNNLQIHGGRVFYGGKEILPEEQ